MSQTQAQRRKEWCQPRDQAHRIWMVYFDDADRNMSVFDGEDAEREAREFYRRADEGGWNCYLFAVAPETAGKTT